MNGSRPHSRPLPGSIWSVILTIHGEWVCRQHFNICKTRGFYSELHKRWTQSSVITPPVLVILLLHLILSSLPPTQLCLSCPLHPHASLVYCCHTALLTLYRDIIDCGSRFWFQV